MYKEIVTPHTLIAIDVPSCPVSIELKIDSGDVAITLDLDYEQVKALATAFRAAKEEMWENYHKKWGGEG